MMQHEANAAGGSSASRRSFLKSSAAAVIGSGLALESGVLRAAHAAGSETLRIGLVGCGGRGTGAAAQALRADPHTKLVAMADAFEDQLEKSLNHLQKVDVADRVEVDADHRFVGFDGYKGVLASDVDVVLLAAPPQFRPLHLEACIDADKHVFAEKPVAVDAPGVRSVLETCKRAKQKDLSVVSGLCWRYETGMQNMIDRIHEGGIGDLVALESTRYNGLAKPAPPQGDMTGMQWQMRNWYNFTWLSGDFIVEQFVHELDKMAWVMNDEYPIRCSGTGGRQTRTGTEFGHIYDHFSVIFEYDNGVKYFASTRQQPGCGSQFIDMAMGTKGNANLMRYTITGKNPWRWRGRKTSMHQAEHDVMYAALRKGETINNGDYMSKSTLMGIMGRMAAYTGKTLTWEQVLNSEEDLTPEKYDWDLALPVPPVAMPGITPFV